MNSMINFAGLITATLFAAAAALVQPDVPTGITIKAALAEFYDG